MDEYNERLSEYISHIDKALFEYLPQTDRKYSLICDAMKYSLESGGKRIRPVLTLEFCRLCGGNYLNALPFAAAVEYIHTYSLIHDDLPCMDDDDMRRGRPSSHIKFGEANALLAGDALLTFAFEAACAAEKSGVNPSAIIKAVKLLSRHSGVFGMIGGQYIDLSSENISLSLEELEELDIHKTCALIMLSCELGCIAAEAGEKAVEAARSFALNLGLAFQVTDDILDAVSTTQELGKPVRSDEENNKSTYYSILGEACAREKAKEYTCKALAALDYFKENSSFLKELASSLLERKS